MPPARRDALKGTAFSVIMQDPLSSFNPVFRIGRHLDDVMYYADRRLGRKSSAAERRDRIFEVLRKVQLDDPRRIVEAYPSQLSGGMRQRVLIALSLLHQPDLLIADEPGTALDVTTQDEIMKLINQLVADNGLSLLMITHNLGVVRQMADDVYVMRHGEIVENGTLADIFSSPRQAYTRQLIDAIRLSTAPRSRTRNRRMQSRSWRCRGVTKVFEQKRLFGAGARHVAVSDVTLSVRRGRCSGWRADPDRQTTVARMVMGLIGATQGSISVDGKAVEDERGSDAFRRKIQIVYRIPAPH